MLSSTLKCADVTQISAMAEQHWILLSGHGVRQIVLQYYRQCCAQLCLAMTDIIYGFVKSSRKLTQIASEDWNVSLSCPYVRSLNNTPYSIKNVTTEH